MTTTITPRTDQLQHSTLVRSPAPATTDTTAAARPRCAHPMWGEPGGLPCTRDAGHDPGHIYHDPHGSDVDDRHNDGGHG
ncbi:hypothetical protein [Nocardioides sp.]|uniref:hypothetical protein n=1 Tax=Nocardioides sp. TaxID=35761 RepID=UPI0027371B29|nr:hypothetical protein [Nocardioides sp.]MDP3889842.1 hypothetical protein [Nocardioides sp.]